MSSDALKFTRLGLLLAEAGLYVYSVYSADESYFFDYSNWSSLFTLLYLATLGVMDFVPY